MKKNVKYLTKFNIYKTLSIFIMFIIICGWRFDGNIKNIWAKDNTKSQPSFEIKELTFNPNEPKIGEDIQVSGVIHPNDFVREVPEKRIVLVLDISTSMKNGGINRIDPLKDAAKKFLDTLKDVPNVKVAVVAFSTDAYINPKSIMRIEDKDHNDDNDNDEELYETINIPKYKKGEKSGERNAPDFNEYYEERFYDISEKDKETEDDNDTCLNKMIDSLVAIGGTSTGEGLRKAEYMFEKNDDNTNAEKTIILMTDGAASFYSAQEKYDNQNYYTDINNHTIREQRAPYLGGNGNTSNDTTKDNANNYAIEIGKKIHDNNVKAYSIGFELDTDGVTRLKKIHNSMTGKSLDTDNIDEEKQMGFFRAGDLQSIDYVFNEIAQNIINKYELTNVELNLGMDENFELSIGGNTIKLRNITYIKQMISNKKILYRGDDVPFNFTIKAKYAGYCSDVFKDSKLTVPWNGLDITEKMPKKDINIISNSEPKIDAVFKSMTEGPYTTEKYIDLTYTIKPNNFKLDNMVKDEKPKDVIIIIDISKGMAKYLETLKVALFNKFFSDNELMTCKTRYSVITYSNEANYKILPDSVKQQCDSESNYAGLIRDEVVKNISLSESNEGKIDEAFDIALNILKNGRGESATSEIDKNRDNNSASKNIIIIGSQNVNAVNEQKLSEKAKKLMESKSNIITLNLGEVRRNNGEYIVDNNIEQMQYMLMGEAFKPNQNDSLEIREDNNYYLNIDYEVDNSSNDNGDFNMNNSIFPRIVKKIKGQFIESYPYNINLMFNKGAFDIDTSSRINDYQGYGEYNSITDDYTITYKRNSSGEYVADEFNISFRIKPNEVGELYFGNPGIISYTNLSKENITSLSKENITRKIDPIKIMVNSRLNILKYGLYEDKSGRNINVNENININQSNNNDFNISKGSNVQIGALLYGSLYNGEEIIIESDLEPNNLMINISGDSQFTGKLEYLKKETNLQNSLIKYTYKYTGDSVSNKYLLIRYSELVPKESNQSSYSNQLIVSQGEHKYLKLNVVPEPDLF